jgi:RNA polymerase sigma-70 factor (ECF subfamily)
MLQKVGMADSALSLAAVDGKLALTVLTADDFDDLVRRNQKRIFRLLMALLRDEDAADTLTQECFLRAYKKRDTFRGDSSVDTWVYRIAVNLARDYQRSKREGFWKKMFSATPETENETPLLETVAHGGSSAESQLLAREEVDQVWYTVKRLSDNQREVFVLRYAEDMSLEEIARTLEMQVGTVKSHLNRALTTVRKRLEEHRRGN